MVLRAYELMIAAELFVAKYIPAWAIAKARSRFRLWLVGKFIAYLRKHELVDLIEIVKVEEAQK
jgi:hypothetical protein